jgi:hypothetical protein
MSLTDNPSPKRIFQYTYSLLRDDAYGSFSLSFIPRIKLPPLLNKKERFEDVKAPTCFFPTSVVAWIQPDSPFQFDEYDSQGRVALCSRVLHCFINLGTRKFQIAETPCC